MILTRLQLHHFRSYQRKTFSFSPHTSIVVGANASGKTNMLEALFLLATGKSFRASIEREMIAFGMDIARVRGKVTLGTKEEYELETVLTKGSVMEIKTPLKRYTVNGVGKRMVDFVGLVKVVLFWPQDMELVTNSPTLRRRYLDFVLGQVDREYRRTLYSYERGVRQRNKVLEALREGKAHRHQLLFWDQLLIKTGNYITNAREAYIAYLNGGSWRASYSQFSHFHIAYEKSIISSVRIAQYAQEEVAAGITLVGPHRDDICFFLKDSSVQNGEDRDLSRYGSRGEQRLAVLWLKCGELSFMKKSTGEAPLFLLDDILSELDHAHRKIIFSLIHTQQTIMTVTDVHLLEKRLGGEVEMISLP